MKLWTYHPEDFKVDDPSLIVDSTQGKYWRRIGDPEFRYREVLTSLCERLGTSTFLWCCTLPENNFTMHNYGPDSNCFAWELDVPLAQVLGFYHVHEWERILKTAEVDWGTLLIQVSTESQAATKEIGALVTFPLHGQQARCLGKVPSSDKVREQR